MKKILFLSMLLWLLVLPLMAIDMKVGDTKTLDIGYVSNLQGCVWTISRPSDVIFTSTPGSYSTSVTIKAIHGFPASSPCIVQCQYYYLELDPTTGRYIYSRTGYKDWTIFVEDNDPTGVSITPSNTSVYVDEWIDIYATLKPSNAESTLTWRIADPTIATYTQAQNDRISVRGLKEGTTTITVKTENGHSATCYLTVQSLNPTGISLPSAMSIIVGESKSINATVYPSNATYTLSWSSDDESVVTVSSSGLVYARREGTARITAKVNGYNLSDYCMVSVKKPTLTLTSSLTGGLIKKGSTVELTASDSRASIYYTLDGSTPNESSTKYRTPITINKNLTLKAIASHKDYTSSNVLTVMYEVTSLEVIDTYPKEGATDMDKSTIPSITFNAAIIEGENFANIKLVKNDTEEIEGEKIISGNTLYFVPNQNTGNGHYSLIIPQKAIKSIMPLGHCKESKVLYETHTEGGTVVSVNTNSENILLIKSDGSLWHWGTYMYPTKHNKPTVIMDGVISAAQGSLEGYDYFAAVKDDGTLMTWGSNYHGWLGIGSDIRKSDTPIEAMDNVLSVDIGSCVVVLKKDGTVWTCGPYHYGGLGRDGVSDKLEQVVGLKDIVSISASIGKSAAIQSNGTLWVWGGVDNSYSGFGDKEIIKYPRQLMYDVRQVSIGTNMAVKNDNTLWEWRYHSTPTKIMDDVLSITEGNTILKTDGTIWAWGNVYYGNGTKSRYSIEPGNAVCVMRDISMVWDTSIYQQCVGVIKNDGSVWSWGYNHYGTVGNGTFEDQLTPVKIMDAPQKIILKSVNLRNIGSEPLTLDIDELMVFQAQLSPSNGEYTSMTWSIDDKNIATISPRGVLTAKAVGTVTVRLEVETEDNKFVCTQKITVMEPKAEDKTLEIAKYATFYDSQSAYTLPSGLTASVVTGMSNGKLTYKVIAEGGKSNNVIPKGVAVMLTSKNEGTSSYTLKPTDNDATYGNTNWLKGSDEATTTTSDGGNSWFYKLSYGPSGSAQSNVFGWYWGAANGGAFNIEGHKAWLAVPTSAGAKTRSYIMEDEATSIADVEVENPARTNDNYYDLQGRHIPKPTSKGIYIHHGKKYIVK